MTLPGYEAQRIEAMEWAYSTKKQEDYDTAVLDADLDQAHPIREVSVGQMTKEIRSDRETIGKGHEFATNVWEVARDTRFTRTFDGSSDILGWLFAFAMGKVTTVFDPATEGTSQLPTTTIVEKVSAGIKRAVLSLAVAGVNVSGEGFEQLAVTGEFIGSGQTTSSSLTMPSLVAAAYLASNYATIKMGDSAEDISTRVRNWSVALANNTKEGRGYFPSSGLYRGRLEIGSRSIVPTIVLDLDATSDILTDFEANTEIALEIYCEGEYTEGSSYKHYLRMRFPNMQYRAVLIEEDEGMLTYNVTFDEETVLYNAAGSPNPLVTVEVQNKVATYLVAST
jgi:hypothetical protein